MISDFRFRLENIYRSLPFFSKINKKDKKIILASGHRVGSTWLYRLIVDIESLSDGANSLPTEMIDNSTLVISKESLQLIKALKGNFIFKSHSQYLDNLDYSDVKLITITRDPRDVVISTVYFLSYLPEEAGGWGEDFSLLPFEKRTEKFLSESSYFYNLMDSWAKCPSEVLSLKYEDLLVNTVLEMRKIADFLSLRVSDYYINHIVKKQSFKNISGRKPGIEQNSSHLRKGVVGDWKNYFGDDMKNIFKKSLQGKWNRLLIDLEYEDTLEW